jgi:carboxypeptidase family protein
MVSVGRNQVPAALRARRTRRVAIIWILALALLSGAAGRLSAAGNGSLSGTVADPSGGVVPGATVTLMNTALGTMFTAITDSKGLYAFPSLTVGRYDLVVDLSGFKSVKRSLAVDADSRLQADFKLELAGASETITVSATTDDVHVERVSTQLGEVVSSEKMTQLSLNGRSYTDLLPIQPGITPVTTMKPNSIIMAGVTGAIAPSGELNPGNVSINGQRESANGFYVNGASVQEHMNGGTLIVPDLDSIAEFRVLTNNFDSEYGNYNGGIINVVTKSGSNQVHGSGFEFLRNTALDSQGYFSATKASFNQNQFGGVLGGPMVKSKLFFFSDYQGTRTRQGIETGLISVPSDANRSGNFADIASNLDGTVNGSYWANLLSQRLGYAVSPGERYYFAGCVSPTQCVLPNAVIPQRAWSSPAQHLLGYIPSANTGAATFSTSVNDQVVRDDKWSTRIDANTRFGLVTGYYFFDDFSNDDPYPVQQGGASVPGFNALTLGRSQLISIGNTKAWNQTFVNEIHGSLMRNSTQIGHPAGGLGVKVADQGFVTGPGTPGIVVQNPAFEGVENVVFNNFAMGVTTTGTDQVNNTWQFSDTASKVIGAHTLRFGGQYHKDAVDLVPNAVFNGSFIFSGTETGSDFADFLLGIPSSYIQSYGSTFLLRNQYAGFFAQDSWRARSSLTVNYGLRWDLIAPWREKYNNIQTIVPGQQSAVYPTAPNGLVFPTDEGIPPTLSPARYKNLAPRIGIAYSPSFDSGILHTLFGENKSSIRAGFGVFYTAFQGLSAGIMYAVPPYGYNYLSPAPPLFATPFITAADGTDNIQRFPLSPAPTDASVRNPYSLDFSPYIPVNADPFFYHDNKVPYTNDYMVSFQRELPGRVVLSASYVGNRGHNLLVTQQANPGNPGLCLSVSEPSQVAPGTPTCGPFAENGVFTRADGTVINGTRSVLGPDFGTVTAQTTIGRSRYDSMELNARYSKGGDDFLIGYTLAKSMDTGSNLGEQVDPSDVNKSYALSSWDMRHNFVASYTVQLPFGHLFGRNGLTEGWSLSGTTRLASGFPVTLYNPEDTSLLGTFGNGVNNDLIDTPNYDGSPLEINHDPTNGKPAFNTAAFSLPPLGELGNAPRRFFHGPGINNTDLAVIKNFRLNGSKSAQVRLEAFNVFNHAQFYGPASVDGNISSPTFGQIVAAAPPRLMQIGMKFMF